MKINRLRITCLFLLGTLAGCSSISSDEQANTKSPEEMLAHFQQARSPLPQDQSITSSFLHFFKGWEGVPYRFGGENKRGIDCSAFVQQAYRETMNMSLPRTTYSQVKVGKQLNYDNVRSGDLVFFRTSRTDRHVGVYLGDKQFMHVSTSKGVIISRLDNPYWASKFWQFRRVMMHPPLAD